MTAESSPLQLGLGVDAPHNNGSLFSDRTLAYLLPQDGRWQAGLDEARAFLDWLQKLYVAEQEHLDSYNEAQLEDHWLRPILQSLGGAGQFDVKNLISRQ